MPTLSVIVTAYNIERYIAQCLDSVINQTLSDIEIIVVDDGSTDGTAQIIKDYAQQDARIRPILFDRNTIGGVASAANAGLDAATGDYVGFADGDDLCEIDMFRQLYDAATAANADLAMCRYLLLDEQTEATAPPADNHRWDGIEAGAVWELDKENRKRLLEFIAVPWRKIYRRQMLTEAKIRFPVGDYFYEDNPFHWFSALSADRIALVPEELCYHRVARIGQTMATVDERLLKIFDHEATIRAWLKSNALDETYAASLLGWVAAQLSWVSQRAEGEMQRRLFDRMVPIIQGYSATDIAIATRNHERNSRIVMMLDALQRKDFMAFSRAAGYKLPEKSLVGLGFYHLRHRGLQSTAMTTVRFMRSRLGRIFSRGATTTLPLNGKLETSLSDIQFALIILQRRLDSIEEELRRHQQKTPDDQG